MELLLTNKKDYELEAWWYVSEKFSRPLNSVCLSKPCYSSSQNLCDSSSTVKIRIKKSICQHIKESGSVQLRTFSDGELTVWFFFFLPFIFDHRFKFVTII